MSNNLYIQVSSQKAQDSGLVAVVMNYQSVEVLGQPNSVQIYDEGTSNNSSATPRPVFIGDTDARAYFDGIVGPILIASANSAVAAGYYTTYTIEEVSAPVYADFNSLATVAKTGNYSDLIGNPTIPTAVSQLTNDSGFVTAVQAASDAPVQSVNGQTGSVSLAIPTNTNQLTNGAGFVDSAGASSAAPVQSVNGQTGTVSLTIPTIPTNVSAFTNDSGYVTSSTAPVRSIAGKTGVVTLSNTDVGLGNVTNVDATNASNISSGTISESRLPTSGVSAGSYTYSSLTIDGTGRITSASNGTAPVVAKSYTGTGSSSPTQINNPYPVFLSGTVSSGLVVFYLTADGTSTGTALFSNGPILSSVNFIVNNSTAIFPGSWAWSNSNKTLTLTLGQSASTGVLSLLGISLLGAPTTAANGTTVQLSVWGY